MAGTERSRLAARPDQAERRLFASMSVRSRRTDPAISSTAPSNDSWLAREGWR